MKTTVGIFAISLLFGCGNFCVEVPCPCGFAKGHYGDQTKMETGKRTDCTDSSNHTNHGPCICPGDKPNSPKTYNDTYANRNRKGKR